MQSQLQYELQQDILKNQVKPYQFINKAHTNSIETIAANPNGKTFASGSHDKLIKIWDIEQLKQIMTLSDHKQGIWSLDYSKDGSQLLSASPDKTIGMWDSRKGSLGLKLIGHKDKVYSAKYNEDNKLVASVGQGAQLLIWDLSKPNAPMKKVQLHALVGYDISWSKDGQSLFTTTFGSKLFAIDSKTFEIVASDTLNPDEESRCQSCDSNFNIFGGKVFCATDKGHITQYTFANKNLKKGLDFNAHLEACRSVTLHPKDKIVLSSGKSGSARLWNFQQQDHPKIIANLVLHQQNVTKLIFAGDCVVSSSWDQKIGLWRMADLLSNK